MESIKKALSSLWRHLLDQLVGHGIRVLAGLLLLVPVVLWRDLILTVLWQHMISTVTMPYWLLYSLLLFLLVIAAGTWLVFHLVAFRPYVRKYRQDIFNGILWRWRYTWWRGKPTDILGYCLKDDMELACTNDNVTDGGDQFVCEKCHARFSGHVTDTDFVRRLIELAIRKRTWVKAK